MSNGSGYLKPSVINPETHHYVCVPIPDDVAYRMAFLGQLKELASWYAWERDEEKTGKYAAEVWREIFLDVAWQLDQRYESCGAISMVLTQEELEETLSKLVLNLRVDQNGDCDPCGDSSGDGTSGGFVDEDGDGIDDNTGIQIPTATELILGRAYGVPQGMQLFINDIFELWDAGSTDGAIALIINSVYDVQDGVVDDLYINQWTAAFSGGTLKPDLDDDAIAGQVYCLSPIRNAVNRYIFFGDPPQNAEQMLQYLLDAVTDEQLSQWYEEGAEQPRSNVVIAPCYKQPSVTFTVDGSQEPDFDSGVQQVTFPTAFVSFPTKRLLRVTLTGSFSDTGSSRVNDPLYAVDENGDVGQSLWTYVRFNSGNSPRDLLPTAGNMPVYDGSHKYVYEVEVAEGQGGSVGIRALNMNGYEGDVVGSITFVIEDLGEFL